ncbi:MAG: Smr/MutS family protein [Gallionellaceae bacterium]|jgi:DNA-nicking Smr family endonuclease
MKKPPPSLAENELFRQAMDGVTPIASSNRVTPAPPARRVVVAKMQQTAAEYTDNFSDHGASDIAATSFLRSGLNNMTLRKLRRGFWPVQDSLDLHGNSSEQARRLLQDFLQHALQRDFRSVSVIHGKGWQSDGGQGILKVRVRHWLTQFPQVLAYCEPAAHAGGGGAVWVLLKSAANKKTHQNEKGG